MSLFLIECDCFIVSFLALDVELLQHMRGKIDARQAWHFSVLLPNRRAKGTYTSSTKSTRPLHHRCSLSPLYNICLAYTLTDCVIGYR
jgi:hypothetical protein